MDPKPRSQSHSRPRGHERSHSSSSSDLSALLSDSDPALAAIHSQRLSELRAQQSVAQTQSSIAANAPGHGIPVELREAEVIQSTADAERSLLFFTHADMAACSRMQRHVEEISRRHPGVYCVKVKAEDATWLAGRMGVQVLPVVVGFVAGKEVGRIVGFEGVSGGLSAGFREIEKTVSRWGVVQVRDDSEGEDEDGEADDEKGRRSNGKTIRSGGLRGRGGRSTRADDDEDSDWE